MEQNGADEAGGKKIAQPTDSWVCDVRRESWITARNGSREGQVLHEKSPYLMGVISLCWRLLCERPPSSLGFGQAHLGGAQAAGADADFEQRRWPCFFPADSAGLGGGEIDRYTDSCTLQLALSHSDRCP